LSIGNGVGIATILIVEQTFATQIDAKVDDYWFI